MAEPERLSKGKGKGKKGSESSRTEEEQGGEEGEGGAEPSKKRPRPGSASDTSVLAERTGTCDIWALVASLGRIASSAASAVGLGRPTKRVVILVDNGSLKASSTLGLRQVARLLQEHLCTMGGSSPLSVIAASARFSDRIDPGELGGERARTVQELLRDLRSQRFAEVVLLPVFFGPSAMVADFIPKQVTVVRSEPGPPMPNMSLAPTLICGCPFNCPGGGSDNRVAQMLFGRIQEAVKTNGFGPNPAIAVVDHGSPTPAVARCREQVTMQLSSLIAAAALAGAPLKPRVVLGCCMERREGAEYDFNGELLEKVLEENPIFKEGEVIVALMFLQPGRHAGPDGDLDQIVKKAAAGGSKATVVMTEVIGAHEILVEVLAERLGQAFRPAGW
ncbi:unnamed protein product [Polarella glacialis]|uniref:Uncharacterized protein n=1 Tax=Polarella glacialis TaxID=89957 RepID=A0A813FRQ2_POLGL|nr:unnamed protein product [Polarella glacialis]CAE8686667.1 unnamed protein product [Polarella glacialis]